MTLKTPELMYHRPLDKESSDNKLDTSKLALYIFPACLKKKEETERGGKNYRYVAPVRGIYEIPAFHNKIFFVSRR